jgi:hypothetical protein
MKSSARPTYKTERAERQKEQLNLIQAILKKGGYIFGVSSGGEWVTVSFQIPKEFANKIEGLNFA